MLASGALYQGNLGIGTRFTRLKRWVESGVLERLFLALQKEKLIQISITCLRLDSISIKVHPDAAGALKKTDHKQSANHAADGLQKFIFLPRMIDLV
jgi:hypothetical protein